MLENFNGIILRTVKYSESSVICDIYTENAGLNTFIISGVRKKNAKVNTALIRNMSFVEFVAYFKKDSKMHRIKEIKSSFLFKEIPFNIYKGSVGLFILEIIQKSIKESEPNQELFEFIKYVFVELDHRSGSINNFAIWFLIEFAVKLGILTKNIKRYENSVYDYSEGEVLMLEDARPSYSFSEKDTEILVLVLKTKLEDFLNVKISQTDRKSVLENTINLYKYYINDVTRLNSYEILREVFELKAL